MKRFKFRFEAVLKHRAVTEQTRLLTYARAQTELAASDVRLVTCRQEYSRTIAERPKRIDIEDIPRRERYIDTLNARIAQEERIREGLAARSEDARAALITARQAREALERIRESDHAEFERLGAVAEQNEIDEMSTQRHRRAQPRG